MIEIHHDTQVALMWSFGYASMDMMGCVYRKEDDDPWVIKYRFRQHLDDKHFDSADTKNWYDAASAPGQSREEAIKDIQEFLHGVLHPPKQFAEMIPRDIDIFVPPNGTGQELMDYWESEKNSAFRKQDIHTKDSILGEAGDLDVG